MSQLALQNTVLLEKSDSQFLPQFFAACQTEFGEESFSKWLAGLEIFSQSESEIIFSSSSKFVRDWVIREFVEVKLGQKSLKTLAQTICPQIKKVAVIYVAKVSDELTPILSNAEQKVVNLSKYDNVFAFGTELNPRFTFKHFVSAKYNKLAVSMAKIAAGIDAQISLFDDKIPLFIHGNVGMGKTHLAQAIAWQIKEFDKSKKVVYLSAEKFMYHFVQSIRGNDVMSFKEKMRSIDVLIVDDVQFIAGKGSTQQEFMNCFNSLVEDNKQVVLVCDRCPSDLENIDEKLKSRISGGMIVNFRNPDYQDRFEILKAKTQMMEQEICEKVLSFIAEKITTSVRDLEGTLKKLVAQKVLLGEEITLESAKAILADYIRASNSTAPTIEKIQKIVAAFYGIKIADLTSANRARSIARPRQIAMYLAKTLTSNSLPIIGKEFGGKNHATVIHSVKLVTQLIGSDQQILQEVKGLEEKIR
ncbi:MAG: chromosomal replication initiator protein DnaA [Rickettsiales bacterium]|nr:chromosomal replication initiator protein DnaA [Rickettsiales bacterium]